MYSHCNFVVHLFISRDKVTSGFVAAILDFQLPVKSSSIFNSLIRLPVLKYIDVAVGSPRISCFISRIWLELQALPVLTPLFVLYIRFHIPNITFQCEIFFHNKRLKNSVDCSTHSKVMSKCLSGYFLPPPSQWNGTFSRNHWNDKGKIECDAWYVR